LPIWFDRIILSHQKGEMNMVMNALLNTIFHPDVYVVVVCPSKKRVFLLNRNYGIINEHVLINGMDGNLQHRHFPIGQTIYLQKNLTHIGYSNETGNP
jgi:hypothetical protein